MSDLISLDTNEASTTASSAPKDDVKSSPTVKPDSGGILLDATPQQDIFSQPKANNEDPNKIVSSVLNTKDPVTKAKPILGNAAALQKSIREEQQDRQRRKLRTRKTLFAFTFMTVLGMAAYFMVQFTASDFFPHNKTAELTDLNTKVRSAQTEFNKYRFLVAQLHLNAFSYETDTFFDKADQLNRGGLNDTALHGAASEVSQYSLDLPETIRKVRDAVTTDIAVQTFHTDAEPVLTNEEIKQQYENDLRSALNDIKLSDNGDGSDDSKLINNTLKLVGNVKLVDTLKQTSIDSLKKDFTSYAGQLDETQRGKLQQLTSSFLTTTISDIAVIRTLKGNRVAWSKILKEIDTLTVEVDPTFGKGLFDTLQEGIMYTGYEFETATNKIVLSGITKTSDARNFRLMSDLIDTLSSSPMFGSVEMRSFTKSGSADEGYTAHFKIDITLKKDPVTKKSPTPTTSSHAAADTNATSDPNPVTVAVARKKAEESAVDSTTPTPAASPATDGQTATPTPTDSTPTSTEPTSPAPQEPVAQSESTSPAGNNNQTTP